MKATILKSGQRMVLPALFVALAYGFAVSPPFQRIAAGVAIFLFGMLSLEQGFKTFNGGMFEQALRRATQGMLRSIGFGALTTALVQSSSLISVLTISFLSAGLISLASGVGVVFGANLGTTTGAWLVAGLGLKVNISAYAMPLLVFGVILLFQQLRVLKGLGYVLVGIGFLFLGIHEMKEGFEAFKDVLDISRYAVEGLQGVLLYTGIGVLATVIMQSSHATLVLTITALAAQQLSYENALGLAIGSNLGTTISAVVGAIGANVEGRRLAAAHVIFNGVTAVVAIALLGPMIRLVEQLALMLGLAADDFTLRLAIFHSLFNLLGLLLVYPWRQQLLHFLETRVRAAAVAFEDPRFLSAAAMEMPETALAALRDESVRLYERAEGIIAHGIGVHRHQLRSEDQPLEILGKAPRSFSENVEERYEQGIKSLYAAIVDYSGRVSSEGNPEVLEQTHALRHACRNIVEAVKALKHLQKNLQAHMHTGNPELRQQYDQLRLEIIKVLRAIDAVRGRAEDAVIILSLDGVRLRLKRADILSDERIDQLIRHQHLDARLATSLMKDADYVYRLCQSLLDAAATLFASSGATVQQVEQSVALSDEELERLARKQSDSRRGAG